MDPYKKQRHVAMMRCLERGMEREKNAIQFGSETFYRCACALRCDLVLEPPKTFAEAKARGFPNGGHASFPQIPGAVPIGFPFACLK